jgi:hypothetical protein
MQNTGLGSPFDFYDEFDLGYSTLVAIQFDSPNIHSGARERLSPEFHNRGADFCPLRYTILWRLQLRKSKITKLTKDT